MAGTPKAQDETDVALGSAAAATASPAQLHRRYSPAATSPPSPLTPTRPPPREQPLTVESFNATVQELMRALENQRLKLAEQAKAIAYWEGSETPPQPQQFQMSTASAEAEWGDDHGGYWRGGRQDPWWRWLDGGWKATDPWSDPPCLLYTSPSPRDRTRSRMPSSA